MIALFQIQIQRNQSIIIDKAFDHKMCKWHQEAVDVVMFFGLAQILDKLLVVVH